MTTNETTAIGPDGETVRVVAVEVTLLDTEVHDDGSVWYLRRPGRAGPVGAPEAIALHIDAGLTQD